MQRGRKTKDMWREKNRILMLLLAAVVLIFAAVLSVSGREERFEKDAGRFALVICTGGYYWEDILAGIQKADDDFGTYTKYLGYDKFDMEEQAAQLEKAGYMEVDGIITVGEPQAAQVNEMLREFGKQGLPVVLIDSDAKESGRTCYIGSDNYAAGELAAEKIAQAAGEQGNILVVTSWLDSSNQRERLDGFRKGIGKYSGMEIVSVIEGETNKTLIDEKVRQAFEEFDGIRAIFCEESSSATQIGYIMQSDEKFAGVQVVCFDTNDTTMQFIENGTYLGAIKQDGFAIGYEAVRYLNGWTEESATETSEHYSSLVYIDKSNLHEFYEGNPDE